MIEAIICDDDKCCRCSVVEIVKNFFNKQKKTVKIKEYSDYDDNFIKDIVPGNRKIYILDIETPSRSGIDIARIIRKRDVESIIIFITGYEEFGKLVLTKNIMCLSFINKFENLKENLIESLTEAMHFFETNKVLRITDNGVTYNIRQNSVLYLTRDSLDRRTIVMCDKTEYKFKMSLMEVKKIFGDAFVQTHRSCFVNEQRIDNIDHKNKTIKFDNGLTIDLLSDTYRKELMR